MAIPTWHSETFMKLDNTQPVHQHNLQYLIIEIYKAKNSLFPSLMSEVS